MAESVLVTGGAGFIGSHIVDSYLQAGHSVAVLDNLHTGKRENVNPDATFYEADLRDAESVARIVADVQPAVISHQAALADVRGSLRDPVGYVQTNVVGTLNLLEAARTSGVRKLIFASTGGAIYGDAPRLPADEDTPARPLDPYGVSKLAAEHYIFSYHHNYGLEFCVLRYANVYGPRQDPFGEAGVIAVFMGKMLAQEAATINGDGLQERDFVYVGDVARANLAASTGVSGIYNIGTGVGTNINTIFAELADLTRYSEPERHGPAKQGEVRRSILDARAARGTLGWEPRVPLRDGLAATVQYFENR